jgi:hypothetical protein
MEDATEERASSQEKPPWHSAAGWQVLWFLLHLAAVYAIVNFCTAWLAGWTRGTLLPLLQQPTTLSSFEFLFSHLFVFSFIPAFAAGLANARFKHKVAEFVWLVPAVVLTYKFLTFPTVSVLQSQSSAAFHQYFGGGFSIPDFRNWIEFWTIVRSNPDMLRGKAQLDITAPLYAGVAYSLAAWLGRRTELSRNIAEKVKNWQQSRFEDQP